ncbi:putative ABC transport system ATP-binding protein [Novimethylophilus kurashikiensis]|uniref:Putative ABC transport system ATP-binding protein n=1 Tax=Novimethylophilus kurashikiensis TaxID=1825523 RepID=A0A2R5FCN0_9PROT|nr:ATP-binding cassette domain-containing protein [Novimethylophilus kurashikiensis]GBG15950.1 putative ABC transport system ATP-binding protein [Novimethylophilus kurashikiensis]
MPTPVIEARQLAKHVNSSEGTLTILHVLDLVVKTGETVAIVGASGSGKSTLLGLLAGLDAASEGQVLINGVALDSLDEDGRAALRGKEIGFVFQSFQLLPAFTALENVLLPLELAERDNPEQLALAALSRVGLQHRLSHTPSRLSGGEQQRVAIARAFAPGPKLLLADEPTGNLDSATGERIIDLLFELNREAGTTLVLVTHDPVLAARCSRTLKLEGGRLA